MSAVSHVSSTSLPARGPRGSGGRQRPQLRQNRRPRWDDEEEPSPYQAPPQHRQWRGQWRDAHGEQDNGIAIALLQQGHSNLERVVGTMANKVDALVTAMDRHFPKYEADQRALRADLEETRKQVDDVRKAQETQARAATRTRLELDSRLLSILGVIGLAILSAALTGHIAIH